MKLSSLLREAAQVYRAALKDPTLIFDAGKWHDPASRGKCRVCLWGCKLAKKMGMKNNERDAAMAKGHEDFSWDYIMHGDLQNAYIQLTNSYADLEPGNWSAADYEKRDPNLPRKFLAAARKLERIGL